MRSISWITWPALFLTIEATYEPLAGLDRTSGAYVPKLSRVEWENQGRPQTTEQINVPQGLVPNTAGWDTFHSNWKASTNPPALRDSEDGGRRYTKTVKGPDAMHDLALGNYAKKMYGDVEPQRLKDKQNGVQNPMDLESNMAAAHFTSGKIALSSSVQNEGDLDKQGIMVPQYQNAVDFKNDKRKQKGKAPCTHSKLGSCAESGTGYNWPVGANGLPSAGSASSAYGKAGLRPGAVVDPTAVQKQHEASNGVGWHPGCKGQKDDPHNPTIGCDKVLDYNKVKDINDPRPGRKDAKNAIPKGTVDKAKAQLAGNGGNDRLGHKDAKNVIPKGTVAKAKAQLQAPARKNLAQNEAEAKVAAEETRQRKKAELRTKLTEQQKYDSSVTKDRIKAQVDRVNQPPFGASHWDTGRTPPKPEKLEQLRKEADKTDTKRAEYEASKAQKKPEDDKKKNNNKQKTSNVQNQNLPNQPASNTNPPGVAINGSPSNSASQPQTAPSGPKPASPERKVMPPPPAPPLPPKPKNQASQQDRPVSAPPAPPVPSRATLNRAWQEQRKATSPPPLAPPVPAKTVGTSAVPKGKKSKRSLLITKKSGLGPGAAWRKQMNQQVLRIRQYQSRDQDLHQLVRRMRLSARLISARQRRAEILDDLMWA